MGCLDSVVDRGKTVSSGGFCFKGGEKKTGCGGKMLERSAFNPSAVTYSVNITRGAWGQSSSLGLGGLCEEISLGFSSGVMKMPLVQPST